MQKQRYFGEYLTIAILVAIFAVMAVFFGYNSSNIAKDHRAIKESFVAMTKTSESQSTALDSGTRLESKNTDSEFLISISWASEFAGCENLVYKLASQRDLSFSYIGSIWIDDITPRAVSEICDGALNGEGMIAFQGDLKKKQSETPRLNYRTAQKD